MSEKFTEKTKVKGNPYRAKQASTFQFLGTTPEMWQMCDIFDLVINEEYPTGLEPSYTIPKGYHKVEPIYEQFGLLENQLGYNCQLCGHDILWLYPIKCASKKIFMFVGSECVNNFLGAGYTIKTIREYHHNMTRQKLGECLPDLVTQCNNHEVKGWLDEPFYSFRKKLHEIEKNPSEFSHRKLINVLKKAKEIGLNAERTKKEINHEKKQKEAEQKRIDKEYEDKLNAIMQPLKAIGLMPLTLPFTGKYFKICNIPKDDFNIRYTLNYSEIETVKKLGGFYWDHVDGWVIPAPIKGVIT